ncbi:translation initiation factor eIF-2B subunit delta [Lucilia sericata]|uniref:translation initiation factor eIF-2B subunit delta n=1 Tax=Lucilia sericata TaxID=13632 RepID=UPI0018A878E0|nr:translation initiation factor eIF-2B subunit delta [Lucilia sericata]
MNTGEIITTEINTEIKVEVQLETASIVKVETKAIGGIENTDVSTQEAIDMMSNKQEVEKEKTRDEIKAEREAKKLAKQAKKQKAGVVAGVATVSTNNSPPANKAENINDTAPIPEDGSEKTREQIKAEREAKNGAERKEQYRSSRAAKAQAQSAAATKEIVITVTPQQRRGLPKRATSNSPVKTVRFNDGNVKLFSHLEKPNTNANLFVNNTHIHPSIARLGEQYAKRTIVGSNARCMAFLSAIKMVIEDYETPAKKEFSRSLESFIANCVEYLQKCRTLAVSVINAHKSLKQVLMQLPKDEPESELKERLFIFIDTYIENQIFKAAQAINSMMQKKINNGDVILTFGCSSLINYICEEAQARKVDFRVIVVDSRPFCEGQELLRRLTANEIPCSYVLINAVSFVMPEVTKVLLGAHALLANGYVMARTGTAQVALVARSFNVPVLVCCETHKFSERFQTDAIVYNELGNPDDIVVDDKCCLSNWQAKHKMSPLNLNYDITPPELVTAVVTEVSVLPCTSVPVILRMKPDWLV